MRPAAFTTVLLVAALAIAACTDAATDEPDPDAMFSHGTALLSQGSEAGLRAAIDTLTHCTEVAPGYAPCHAGLARAYASIGGNFNIMGPDEAWPPARRAAEKAVELNGNMALAHLALAEVLAGQDWDWAGAEREYLRAIELAPDDVETLLSRAWFLYRAGRLEDAAATIDRIRTLDPAFTDPFLDYGVAGDAERAKQEAAGLIASEETRVGGHWTSANICASEGQYEQAVEHLQKQIPLMEGDVVDEVALLGHVYARMGREAEAREMLDRLDELSSQGRHVSPVNKAWIYAGLGEVDETLDLLREGIETRANRAGLDMTVFAYVFEPVSGDPRFGALLEGLGLKE